MLKLERFYLPRLILEVNVLQDHVQSRSGSENFDFSD